MSITILTYSTPNFNYSKSTLLRSAKKYGINNSYGYTNKDFVKTNFYHNNIAITSQPRGAGYWIWKPYYILKVLESLSDNDVLVYCDSGVDIIGSLDPLIKIVQEVDSGAMLFENYQASAYFHKTQGLEVNEYNLYTEVNKNKYWAKRDTFVLMDMDSTKYWNSPQVNANFQLYRKCNASIAFLEEWLNYCCNEQILTDLPNVCGLPNFKNMFAHIHDQAIISLLAEKYQIELFRCPSQFGNHYKMLDYRNEGEFLLLPYSNTPKLNSYYSTLTNHHRTKFMPLIFRWKSFLKQEAGICLSYFSK